MKPRYYYFDPLDIFKILAGRYLPFELIKTYRHANGFHRGIFKITWDGITKTVKVGTSASRYRFNTNFPPPHYTHEEHMDYWIRVETSRLATDLIRQHFDHRTEHFHIAQSYIMSTVLFHYPDEAGYIEGGSSRREWSVDSDAKGIRVRDDRGESKFTWYAVAKSITDQLEQPQQLKLFA